MIRSVGDDDFLHVMMPLIESRAAPKEKKDKAEKEPAKEAAK